MSESTQLFTSTLPTLQRAWDSTSLGLLKECPRKYFYTIVGHTVPVGFAVHLSFGIAYHKALEIFDHAKSNGLTHDAAVLTAVRYCMEFGERKTIQAWDPETQTDQPQDIFIPYDREFTNNPSKHRETLVRSVIWYCEHFRDDPCETVILADGKPAVELSFKISLPYLTPDDQPYLLAGHMDRLVKYEDEYWFMDRKTTSGQLGSHYYGGFSPSNQMSLYYAASQIILDKEAKGGIIDAAQILVGGTRFGRGFVHRTNSQQEEWMQDLQYYISQAEHFARTNHYPMNDKSCGNYGGCAFQQICSRDNTNRAAFLKSGTFKQMEWNPLINRGDV